MNMPTVIHLQRDPCTEQGLTSVYICDNWITRLRGVYFRPNFNAKNAILLRQCSSVHGIGLRKTLDVVFLNSDDVVLSVQTLEPNSVCRYKSANSVLELFEGSVEKLGISVGKKIDFGSLLKFSSDNKPKNQRRNMNSECGASMVEFLVVAPVLIFLGMGVVQMGLVYHARNVLDYATFEAARTGAVHQADTGEMRKELAYRLGAIFRGDGSDASVRTAVQNAIVAVNDPLRTQVRIINPTAAAFEDFGVPDPLTGETVLPNSHLQHRSTDVGVRSGVTLQDANLLKIEVTHGYELKFPWFDIKLPGVDFVLKELMSIADPTNAQFYLRGQIPMSAVATVRMQSMAKVNNVAVSNVVPPRPDIEMPTLQTPAAADADANDLGNQNSEQEQDSHHKMSVWVSMGCRLICPLSRFQQRILRLIVPCQTPTLQILQSCRRRATMTVMSFHQSAKS